MKAGGREKDRMEKRWSVLNCRCREETVFDAGLMVRLNRQPWECGTFPRIGKQTSYTVGLQSNGAATPALVKTALRPAYSQTGRHAEIQLQEWEGTLQALHNRGSRQEKKRGFSFHTTGYSQPWLTISYNGKHLRIQIISQRIEKKNRNRNNSHSPVCRV